MIQIQFHSNASTASDVARRVRNRPRVSALSAILACIRHGYIVAAPILEPSSSRIMPSSHLRRCAHSAFSVTIGPA